MQMYCKSPVTARVLRTYIDIPARYLQPAGLKGTVKRLLQSGLACPIPATSPRQGAWYRRKNSFRKVSTGCKTALCLFSRCVLDQID